MLKSYFYNLSTDKINGVVASLIKFPLFLFSLIYGLAVNLLSLAYKAGFLKTYHLKCKVISIGNITWGGTGKTPVVEMVAKELSRRGHRVIIQSRGYKKYQEIGDEPIMLQENLKTIPVIVGKDRVNQAKQALEKFNPDTIILDDGFQHWKLFRDLDIVVIDAMNPFGNGFLIPRGILRQPLSSLERADIFLLTHTDLAQANLSALKQKLNSINSSAEIFETEHFSVGFYNILYAHMKPFGADVLKERKLGMLTAIGNPESFEKTLKNLGVDLSLKFIFMDHYDFSLHDFDKIKDSCLENGVTALLTTQKDAVRLRKHLPSLKNLDIFVLQIEIKINDDEDAFFNRLSCLY